MPFISETELLISPVVANSIMNRSRVLTGVNSYARDLKFDVFQFLLNRLSKNHSVNWFDACCGEGKALHDAFRLLCKTDSIGHVELLGIDLVIDQFYNNNCGSIHLCIKSANILDIALPFKADLISCVHGLHYIGDKMRFIELAYNDLANDGIFIANIDPNNINLPFEWKSFLTSIRKSGVDIKYKDHLLMITKTSADLRFSLKYKGSSISESNNYTGIIAVDSWYG